MRTRHCLRQRGQAARVEQDCGQLSLESRLFLRSARPMKTSTAVPSPRRQFPTPVASAAPWPDSPWLGLPAGDLRSHDHGRILTADDFVLAVGMSPRYYLAAARAPGVGPVGSVLDQAIGFLHARGTVVIRTNLRAPLMWFTDDGIDFSWKKCLVFFARVFLSTDPTDPPWVPPTIWPVVPMAIIASGGLRHWRKVNEVVEAIQAADGGLLAQLAPSLVGMVRRWEHYIARMIILSQRAGQYSAGEREMVYLCDRLLFSIMARFGSDRQLLPVTISRML